MASVPCPFTLALGYSLVNLVVFCIYALDKRRARQHGWRISEATLIVLALFGPFGAYAAMRVFHHKTQKVKFYLVPVFLALHLLVFGYVILAL